MPRRDFMPMSSPETIDFFKHWKRKFPGSEHTEFYNPLPKHYQDIKVDGKETEDKD